MPGGGSTSTATIFGLSLTRALMDNFPVTVAMVDERFFRFAADSFIRQHPPRDPRLGLYGRELPAFLAAMPELAAYPQVPAVAHLEWQILQALAAPSLAPAPFGDLARLGTCGAWRELRPAAVAAAWGLTPPGKRHLAGPPVGCGFGSAETRSKGALPCAVAHRGRFAAAPSRSGRLYLPCLPPPRPQHRARRSARTWPRSHVRSRPPGHRAV